MNNIEKYMKYLRLYKRSLDKIKDIITGNYETLDPLAKQQIENIIKQVVYYEKDFR